MRLSQGLGLQKACDELLGPTCHTVSPMMIKIFSEEQTETRNCYLSNRTTTQLKRDGTVLTPILTLAHSSTPHTPGTWQVHHKLGFKGQMDEVMKGRVNLPATSSGAGPQDELYKNAESQVACTNLGQ